MRQAQHCFVDFDVHKCNKDDGSTASNSNSDWWQRTRLNLISPLVIIDAVAS